jgi:hypothetical protein
MSGNELIVTEDSTCKWSNGREQRNPVGNEHPFGYSFPLIHYFS